MTGARSRFSREKVREEGTRVPSVNTGVFDEQNRGFITRAFAAAEHLLSPFASTFFGVKLLYVYRFSTAASIIGYTVHYREEIHVIGTERKAQVRPTPFQYLEIRSHGQNLKSTSYQAEFIPQYRPLSASAHECKSSSKDDINM